MRFKKLDRVVVTQPVLRAYREPLLRRVREMQLSRSGRDLVVVHASTDAIGAARRDTTDVSWSVEVPELTLRVGPWRLRFRRIPRGIARNAIFVTELAASNLNAIWFALRARPFMLWGHGKNYTDAAHPIADRIESFICRRALGVLIYTPSGAHYVTGRYRLDASRVTAFMNTVDTDELEAAMAEVSADSIRDYANRLDISVDRPTLMYVGGLDADKNVPFLAACIREVAKTSDVQVIVAGRGAEEGLIDRVSAEFAGVVRIGYAGARDKAHMAAIATAFLCPGKIGLLAVDALVLGRPILTVRGRRHAPEAEYLPDEALRMSSATVQEFAALAVAQATKSIGESPTPWPYPRVDASAERISSAIDAASRRWSGIS